jgi:4-hydroxythreonine-4-phosphate dehydrogenase
MTNPIAITMGDASGVGPEVLLRAFAAGELDNDVLAYGDAAILERGAELLGLDLDIHCVGDSQAPRSGALNLVDLGTLDGADLTPGEMSQKAGAAALGYVHAATLDALGGRVSAVTTLPMNKEATQLSTPGFIGHTEYIAKMCETQNFSMMLTTEDVAVAHVSAHVSLREAIERVTESNVRRVIDLVNATLRRFIARPRIAVCGLNPHAGENGLFGDEDRVHILPAIESARSDGLAVTGPHPADTVFYQAIRQDQHDAIVCMYHDQGHAPMKLWGFESAVNVTIGLPIVRTSVDHGTAFDIAWQGTAFTGSLTSALRYARKLVGA